MSMGNIGANSSQCIFSIENIKDIKAQATNFIERKSGETRRDHNKRKVCVLEQVHNIIEANSHNNLRLSTKSNKIINRYVDNVTCSLFTKLFTSLKSKDVLKVVGELQSEINNLCSDKPVHYLCHDKAVHLNKKDSKDMHNRMYDVISDSDLNKSNKDVKTPDTKHDRIYEEIEDVGDQVNGDIVEDGLRNNPLYVSVGEVSDKIKGHSNTNVNNINGHVYDEVNQKESNEEIKDSSDTNFNNADEHIYAVVNKNLKKAEVKDSSDTNFNNADEHMYAVVDKNLKKAEVKDSLDANVNNTYEHIYAEVDKNESGEKIENKRQNVHAGNLDGSSNGVRSDGGSSKLTSEYVNISIGKGFNTENFNTILSSWNDNSSLVFEEQHVDKLLEELCLEKYTTASVSDFSNCVRKINKNNHNRNEIEEFLNIITVSLAIKVLFKAESKGENPINEFKKHNYYKNGKRFPSLDVYLQRVVSNGSGKYLFTNHFKSDGNASKLLGELHSK